MAIQQQKALIDFRGFKLFVERSVPHESALYKVVLKEKDELPVESFLSKSDMWLELIDMLPHSR